VGVGKLTPANLNQLTKYFENMPVNAWNIWLEWIGYIGSFVIAISLTMSSINRLRWYNMVGALIISFYGFAIGALPVGILNLFIVLTDLYYISKIYSRRAEFKFMSVSPTDIYLRYYLRFHRKGIAKFFPDFRESMLSDPDGKKNILTYLIIRNAVVVGVLAGVKNNKILYIYLDYVGAECRDLGAGNYLFKKHKNLLTKQGIEQVICASGVPKHQHYLKKMGFVKQQNATNVFIKKI